MRKARLSVTVGLIAAVLYLAPALASLIRGRASDQPDSAWREFIEGTPEAFGLLDLDDSE